MCLALEARELYHSSNGDRWYLVCESGSDRVFIKHEPNVSSGGRATEIEIGAFLKRGDQGPEHQELLRLIGTLVGASPDSRQMKFTIEFFRVREGDNAHAMLDRTTHVAADLEDVKVKAKSLFLNLDMPQNPDGFRILDQGGNEVFLWTPGESDA
jgi:hypothetical protein